MALNSILMSGGFKKCVKQQKLETFQGEDRKGLYGNFPGITFLRCDYSVCFAFLQQDNYRQTCWDKLLYV